MSRRKAFANERGYTMHFQKSPSCFDFVRQETMGAIANRKRMHSSANDTTVSCPKKHQSCDVKWSTLQELSRLQQAVLL